MNAEIYRDGEYVDCIDFGHYELHESGRVVLRKVTYIRSLGEGQARTDTVILPATVTVIIKEGD